MEESDNIQQQLGPRYNQNINDHEVAQRNMQRLTANIIQTSEVIFYVAFVVRFIKLILSLTAGSVDYGQWSDRLTWWVLCSSFFDLGSLIFIAYRIPAARRMRRGEAAEMPVWSKKVGWVLGSGFMIWQVPGNVFYWSDDCAAPFLSGVSLMLLIYGYIILMLPVIMCCCILCCLPCIFVWVMGIVKSRQSIDQEVQERIDQLDLRPYDPEFHKGECMWAICASDYDADSMILTLACDPRHYFHEGCAKDWFKLRAICPICRTAV